MENWDAWVEAAVARLAARNLIITLYPISLAVAEDPRADAATTEEFELFDGPQPWDRATVEVTMKDSIYRQWLKELTLPSANNLEGEPDVSTEEKGDKKMVLFANNDYLAVTYHPMVRKAAFEAAKKHGMGARSSITSCGYTDYHHRLSEYLARLKKKEACVICPTGFAANMAFMAAVGSVAALTAHVEGKPSKNEKTAIFSDSLNHGSIIDGIRLVERSQQAECFVYRHSDMAHLEELLSTCPMKKKVVMTDSLFSMDGDFARLPELVELRRKYGFLLAVDDAHGTLVCGNTGGGVLEDFDCENDVDICVGTLSKAIACHGGFIACSNKWRQVIESRGRAFILSTAMPVPVAAAAYASIVVAREEGWRRKAVWSLLREFNNLTGLNCTSPIIPMVIGNEEAAVRACRKMIESGMYVVPIRPPIVHPNACRLRITLTSGHTMDDIRRLVDVVSQFTKLPAMEKKERTSKL